MNKGRKTIHALVIILTMLAAVRTAAQVRFTADERFELTGIAAYLAGYPEYSMCRIPSYQSDIAGTFGTYRDHELVQYLRRLRADRGIAYDAVTTSAQMLKISGGCVSLHPDASPEKLCQADPRWSTEALTEYVGLLDRFYRDTDFQDFYDAHTGLYGAGAAAVSRYCGIDTAWFHSFFGRYPGHPETYLSFVNGPCNYALPDRGSMPGFGILMGMPFDPQSTSQLVLFEKNGWTDFVRVLIHELCHNFTNPLYARHSAHFARAAARIFEDPEIRKSMMERAYGRPDTMTCEWMNTLFTAMYLREHGWLYPWMYGYSTTAESLSFSWYVSCVEAEEKFPWLISSIEAMDGFYEERGRFMTVDDYMPVLIMHYRQVSRRLDRERRKLDGLHPEITDVYVDSTSAATIKVTFRFSQSMRTNSYSAEQHPDTTVKLPPDHPRWFDLRVRNPLERGVDYRDDTMTLSISRNALERGRTYGFLMRGQFYQSLMGFDMKEDYPFIFQY